MADLMCFSYPCIIGDYSLLEHLQSVKHGHDKDTVTRTLIISKMHDTMTRLHIHTHYELFKFIYSKSSIKKLVKYNNLNTVA